MFKPEEIPWEIWTLKIEQMQLTSENGIYSKSQFCFFFSFNFYLERQFMREKLSDTLTERMFQITEIM
jgi:hypothetical protein